MSAARAAQRARVGLEDAEVALRQRRRRPSRAPCARPAPGRRRDRAGRRDRGERARPVTVAPPRAEVLVDVGHRRAAQAGRHVVPAEAAAHRVARGVEAVAGQRRRGRCRPRTRPRRRRRRSSRGGSASGARGVQRAADVRPARELRRARCARALRRGEKTGSGAPAHSSTRTSTRSATSASSSRSGSASVVAGQAEARASRASRRCARSDRAPAIASAMRGSACAPSIEHLELAAVAHRRLARGPQPSVGAGRAAPVDRRGRCAVDGARPSRPRCGRRPSSSTRAVSSEKMRGNLPRICSVPDAC